MSDNKVDSDTKLTDRPVSQSYLVANMVVDAATGALAAMIMDTSSVPRTPHRYKMPSAVSGTTNSRSPMAA